MKIIVCVKQVPETEAKIKIADDGRSIVESEVNFILNPYDEYAVEEALRIKEKAGEGEVTVISIGPERVVSALRTALAMGADKAVHLAADPEPDPSGVAGMLSSAIGKMEYNLIICGYMGIGTDNCQVGPMLAELLDLPQVTNVSKLDLDQEKLVAHREVEGLTEVVESSLPAVVTAGKGLNTPRYPSLKGIMTAKKKEIERIDSSSLVADPADPNLTVIELKLPPMRSGGKIVTGTSEEVAREFVSWLAKEVKLT
jgi:electron transfer flavoprotein beta subunit